MSWGLILSEGEIPIYTSQRERVGNTVEDYRRRRPNEYRDKDSPFTKSQRHSRRADQRVEVRASSCPQDGKLSLKADEPQLGQRHSDVERKPEYYHIIFSQKGLEIVHQERRGQVKNIVMEHFNGILFQKSGPANKQHTNQPTNQPDPLSTNIVG